MLGGLIRIKLPHIQAEVVSRFLNATVSYLVTAATLFITFQWLRHQISANALQDILSFFFIAGLASSIEPGTVKAHLLSQSDHADKKNIELLCMLVVCTSKALLVSPFVAMVWFLTDVGEASFLWYLAWTTPLVIIGFITTDLRVIVDAGGRYAHAVWLKQGSLSLGMFVLAVVYKLGGSSIDIAIGAALFTRALWLVIFFLLEHDQFARTTHSIIGPLINADNRRWLDFALTSVLAALSGSIDRILAFRYLPANVASSFFVISELLTKFWLLPYVFGPIVFAKWATGADGSYFTRSAHFVIVALGTIYVAIVTLTVSIYPTYLYNLVGEAFNVYGIVIFSIAIVIVSTSQIFAAELQGRGCARQVVYVFLIITILSVPLFYYCIQFFSIQGVYFAWITKTMIECIFLCLFLGKVIQHDS